MRVESMRQQDIATMNQAAKCSRYFAMLIAAGAAALGTGCASQITTANSVITTACQATAPQMMDLLREAVGGMAHYKFTAQSATEAKVKYNPANPLMGSATIQVRALQATGTSKEGQRVTGVELIYTDITPLMSQDTAFGGGDIISQLKTAVSENAEFQGVACTPIKRF